MNVHRIQNDWLIICRVAFIMQIVCSASVVAETLTSDDRKGKDSFSETVDRIYDETPGVVREQQSCTAESEDFGLKDTSVRKSDLVLLPRLKKCRISVNAVSKINNPDIVLIDVRHAREFSKFHIVNAINVPLHSVKTKNFLKTQHIVLINEGYDHNPLDIECHYLIEAGFSKVSVLDGGLLAWNNFSPLKGDPLEIKKLNQLSPRNFESIRENRSWVIVSRLPVSEEDKFFLSGVEAIQFKDDKRAFRSEFYKLLERMDDPDKNGIIVVNDNEKDNASIERALHSSGIPNVFYLAGGLKSYKRYMNDRKAALARLATPRRIKTCGG